MAAKGLETYSTEALVAELQRRFDAVEKAKAALLGTPVSGTGFPRGNSQRRNLAAQISSLVQRIRHARARKEDTSGLEKQLQKVRTEHRKSKHR